MTLLIILSTLGSSHASVMTGARVTFAQARDGLLFRFLGRVNPRFETPAVALWTQLALSCAMVLVLKDFQSLADSFVFTNLDFLRAGGGVGVQSSAAPARGGRPFRVPGYPYVPAIFVLTSAVMTVLAVMDDPKTNGLAACLVAGVPVYYAWRWTGPTRRPVAAAEGTRSYSQLHRRERHRREHRADQPEADDDLRLGPALALEVVMERGT